MTNPNIQNLMQKEVSRKEFLGLSALAVASIFCFSAVIKLLTGKSLSSHKCLGTTLASSGYGK